MKSISYSRIPSTNLIFYNLEKNNDCICHVLPSVVLKPHMSYNRHRFQEAKAPDSAVAPRHRKKSLPSCCHLFCAPVDLSVSNVWKRWAPIRAVPVLINSADQCCLGLPTRSTYLPICGEIVPGTNVSSLRGSLSGLRATLPKSIN